MKFQSAIITLMAVALNGVLAPAQTPPEDANQRAVQVLRKTIREQEQPAAVPSARRSSTPTYEELERQYLAHQITARQFQQYIRDYKLVPLWPGPAANTNLAVLPQPVAATAPPPPMAPAAASTTPAPPAPPASAAAAGTKPTPPPPPATVAKPAPPPPPATVAKPVPPSAPATVTDMEAKMDELLLLKAARERAKTNAPPTTGQKSKRERLNEMLRLVVEGQMSDAEYKQMRAKILAEKD